MNHEIAPRELERILKRLREAGDAEDLRIASELEGTDLREAGLVQYDPPEDFKQHILTLCEYLRMQLFLNHWHGRIVFKRLSESDDTEDSESRAAIRTNYAYEYYTIAIGMPMLHSYQDQDFKSISQDICHELVHVHLEELRWWARSDCRPSQEEVIGDVVERTVQRLSRAICDALPDGWWKPEYLADWKKRTGA